MRSLLQPITYIKKEVEIKQIKTTKYNSLLFSFNGNDGITIFYKFCEDLINQTANYKGESPYSEIVNRYNQWRKMFYASKNILSEQEIQGLIGELLFLRDFGIKKYGSTCALNSWSGPEPTHKDFSYEIVEGYLFDSTAGYNQKDDIVTISVFGILNNSYNIADTIKEIEYSSYFENNKLLWDYPWYIFPFQLCSTPLYVLPFVIFLKNETSPLDIR